MQRYYTQHIIPQQSRLTPPPHRGYNVAMPHQHKTLPPKRTPRTRHRRFARPERSLLAAACLSALVFLGMALLIGLIELALPTSALHNFYELAFVNGQVNPQSPIYQDTLDQVKRTDLLFATPFSLFCGGLSFPFLAPRSAARPRVLRASALVAAAITIGYLLLFWGSVLDAMHGRLQPGMLDAQTVLTQTAFGLAGIAAFVLGVFLGLLGRSARRSPDADNPPSVNASAAPR